MAVVGSLLASAAHARRTPLWSYGDLLSKSDLVVIARPISSESTAERSDLPGIFAPAPDGTKKPVPAIGVETRFEVAAVMKGSRKTQQFTLHHYRLEEIPLPQEATESGRFQAVLNGPLLVSFPPGDTRTYLLFLVREKDGRYAPTAGQTEPAMYSVHPLEGQPWPTPRRE